MPWKVPTHSAGPGMPTSFSMRPRISPGGLVRERDRENALRRGILHLDQPGDAVREHAGLAAAGARQHHHRAKRCRDRCALRVVQRIEEGETSMGAAL